MCVCLCVRIHKLHKLHQLVCSMIYIIYNNMRNNKMRVMILNILCHLFLVISFKPATAHVLVQ